MGFACWGLYQMFDEVGAVAWEHVDDGNLDHRVAGGLEAHRGASDIDQNLTGEGRIVDLHVELQTLVLGLTADALADEVDTMTHVANIIDALYLEDVRLVAGEIGVSLDILRDLFECEAVLQLDIYHATVDAFAQGDSHRKGVLDASLRTYADAVTHGHTRTEVGVGQSLRCEALHERADDGVGTRVPTSSNDADGVGLFVDGHQTLAIAANVGVDVEGIDGVDAQRENLLGIFLARTCGCSQNGDVDILQFLDVLDNGIRSEFCWFVSGSVSAYDTCYLEVGSGLKSLNSVLSNVAVTDYGGSDFLHIHRFLLVVSIFQRAKLHFFLEINNKKTENFAKRLHFIIFYTLLTYAVFPFNVKL